MSPDFKRRLERLAWAAIEASIVSGAVFCGTLGLATAAEASISVASAGIAAGSAFFAGVAMRMGIETNAVRHRSEANARDATTDR